MTIKDKRQLNLRVSPQLYEQLQALAKENERSLNNYCERILRKAVYRRTKT